MCTADNPEMDDLPPPPYAEVADDSNILASQPVYASLRGGYMRPSLPSEVPSDDNNPSSAYFEDRDGPNLHRTGVYPNLVEHTITLNSETTRNDLAFPLPIETYVARDVTSLDWATFVNFVSPMHDEVCNEKLRHGRDSQRHSFVRADTPARRDRILAVIAEWNENFFNPRQIHINVDFTSLPPVQSSQSTAMLPAAQSPYVRSRPLEPAQSTTRRDPHAQWSGNLPPSQPIQRSLSTSSSSSSSFSSVDSIKSRDLEGADLSQIRTALLSFRLDGTKKDHLRASVRQLRDEFRSQRRDLSGKESRELKKEYRNQQKVIKEEIKAAVKEVRATRKADRQIRKAERKTKREGKKAKSPSNDRVQNFQDKGSRVEEKATERVRRAEERGREVERLASEKGIRAHERVRELQAQGATVVARAQEKVAEARAKGWNGEAVATQRAQEIQSRTGAAEQRAREVAGRGRTRYQIDGGRATGS